MSKLKGTTKLCINNVPVPDELAKIGLMEKSKYVTKTYRIAITTVEALENITARFREDAGIDLAQSKVLELLILHCSHKSLEEVLSA